MRVVSVERGVDPRDFALLAFGGAGPLHAAASRRSSASTRMLFPRDAGVLCALGLAVSDLRRDYAAPVLPPRRGAAGGAIDAAFARVGGARARGSAPSRRAGARRRMRYAGQSFELPCRGTGTRPGGADAASSAARGRYGYRDAAARSSSSTSAWHRSSSPELLPEAATEAPGAAAPSNSTVSGSRRRSSAARRPRRRGRGPRVFELPESTCVVPPGWGATVDDAGTIDAERS